MYNVYVYMCNTTHACVSTFPILPQADLAFKQEEKEKSEATAKTLELGMFPQHLQHLEFQAFKLCFL